MKKTIKIIAIVLGVLVLLGGIIFAVSIYFTLSGIGNPIVRHRAEVAIAEYIESEYPNNDFEEIDVIYNFKFSTYGTGVASKSSEDTHFYISYMNGMIDDTYETYVTGGMNTCDRLTAKFDDYVTKAMEDAYPDQIELCVFDMYSTVSKIDYRTIIAENVPLDGDLTITDLDDLGIEPSIVIWFYTEDITFANLSQKLIQVRRLLNCIGIYPVEYSINLRLPEDHEDRYCEDLGVHDFPAELIGAENFMKALTENYKQGQQTGKDDD